MSEQKPTPGRIVQYVISETDATEHAQHPRGNAPRAGDVLPAVVVRVWDDGLVNLKVFLDGPEDHWATSRREGTADEPATWHWPARA